MELFWSFVYSVKRHENRKFCHSIFIKKRKGRLGKSYLSYSLELPPIPGEPRVLSQLKPGEVSLIFDRPLSLTTVTATAAITKAPDIVAFVVQWIESRYFLRDYLNSLSPDIAAAIHSIGSSSVLFPPHLSAAVPTAITEAGSQVGFRELPWQGQSSFLRQERSLLCSA
ncbi:unnamed protein product [Hydatigera taeniaeformis]|uniref:Uncharacterized protein n=1 Tax=Hydatigena taeniaeformis TaxID=6205 RepID=A0A3P7EXW4_HYDTA|nr:unnamed protein product [Hydatigera taeniaeformis]